MTKIILFLMTLLVVSGSAFSQSTTINTTLGSTGYTGTNSSGTNGFITFLVENNSGMDIILTDVGNWTNSTHNGSTATLWYTATALSGAPTLATPVWNIVASNVIAGLPAPLQVNDVISGMNFVIPNGVQYRFALANNTGTNYYSGSGPGTASPNSFTGAGVILRNGDYQISGQYVGYGATNNPRFFTGSITFKPAGIPCTGVPTTTISGVSEICAGFQFTLQLQPTFNDAEFIWEKSVDNKISWTPYTGTVGAYGAITDAIITPTWYRLTVKCKATGLTYTTMHLVELSDFYYCYCDNRAIDNATENRVNTGRVKITALPGNDVRVNNVTITGNQVNNANASRNYTDFRRALPPIKMYRDSTFIFELSQFNRGATMTASTVLAFLDYDRNGIFDDYERIHFSNSFAYGVPGEIRDTFKVSDTAHIGLTGMRIIIKNGNTVPDSCGNYANGETEDYLVDIRYQPCTGPVNAGIVEATDTTMCPDYMYVVTDTTYERKLSEISRAWEMSADNEVWKEVANSSSKDNLMRIFSANQPFYYRMRMVCDATKDTSYTAPMLINKKPAYKCYCYSQSEGGLSDTSDLGGIRIVDRNFTQGGGHLGNPKAYYQRKDFTDMQPIVLTVDSSYAVDIYHMMPTNHHGDAKVTLFMDFNNNHVYDIPEDRVYTGFTSTSSFVLTPTITIPNNAIVGRETGMRIIINNDVSPNAASDSACGTYVSGETEDYLVYFHRNFPVNINKTDGIRNLQVFPNPTTGRFHIGFQHGGTVKDIHVSVSNVTGQKILSRSYTGTGNSFSEDLSLEGVAPGVYFVELNVDGRKEVTRLTVK